MSKRALELLTADLPAADATPKLSASRRAVELLRTEAPREFVGPPVPPPADTRPWWQQGLETKPGATFTHPRDLARVAVGAADMTDYALSAAGDQIAGTLSGIGGALNPNDTYIEARDRFRRENEAAPNAAARLRTGGGEAVADAAGKLMSATGIPQIAGPAAEFAQEHFPITADLAATALIIAPTARALRRVAPDAPPTRAIMGESGEVLGREAIDPNAPVRLGTQGGASAAAVDMSKIRSPELRAELQARSAAGNLNPEVAQAQIAADNLGLPPLTRGQATGDAGHISREQNMRGEQPVLRQRFEEQNAAMVDAMDNMRREAAPNVVGNDVVQNGQSLLDAYKKHDEAVNADISAKYTALRDAMKENNVSIDHETFATTAEAALRESGKTHWLPAEVRALMNDAKAGMTFRDFETMRTVLASAARTADRAGNGNAAGAIGAVRSALEALPLVGEAAETLKPLADAARTSAKTRFDALKLDPAYRAAVDDDVAMGEASALADKFVDKYVVRAPGANVARMRSTLSGDPTAGETITAGALNYLKKKAVPETGNFAAARYNEALRELGPRMRELVPEAVAEQLTQLGDYARATTVQPRGAFVNNSNTATALLAEGAQNAAEGVLQAHGVPTQMLTGPLKRRAARQYAEAATAPGAGLDSPRLNRLLRGKLTP